MPRSSGATHALGAVGSVGFAFVLAVVMGWWAGATLDRWLGTGPWLTFLMFFLGLAAGALNVFRAFGRLAGPAPGQEAGPTRSAGDSGPRRDARS
ncbi:MAG: AtpZ/AtpI family protein [Acidobacteria bacterium]|nr:AtpZ/AtpI family protein [Acidobacteriota bacterium]